jgi:uncharacterized protein YndB with AHSA1/START domain
MAHPFEIVVEQTLDASPEQVWEAVTTGPGMDGWFMGRNHVTPGVGGTVRIELPGADLESTITTWDPPHRFVHVTPEGDDGRVMTFAYDIEGRDGGSVLRFVHSGALPDDEWEAEYDALQTGDPAFIAKLETHLKHFRGRRATPLFLVGSGPISAEQCWAILRRELGVGPEAGVGAPVRAEIPEVGEIDGVVEYVSRDFFGVRTDDAALYFVHGLGGPLVLEHHLFDEPDAASAERAWSAWLERVAA